VTALTSINFLAVRCWLQSCTPILFRIQVQLITVMQMMNSYFLSISLWNTFNRNSRNFSPRFIERDLFIHNIMKITR